MSFLFEDSDFLSYINKLAQTPSVSDQKNTEAEKNNSILTEALGLAQKLQTEVSGGFNFTAERGNADLSQAHVVNVDELLNFLKFNGIKANGKFLVIDGISYNNLADNMKAEYAKYSDQYYLYKNGLSGFLQNLSNNATQNPMLKAVVAKLQNDLASFLPKKTPETGVAGSESPDKQNPQAQNPNQSGGASGTGGVGLTPQILMQLSSLKPFNSQFISFPEIEQFINLYAKVANDPTVTNMVSKINDEIRIFKDYTGMGSDTIQLYNMTTEQFKSLLKNPASAQIAAGLLYDVVVYGGQLYQRLVTQLQTIAQDPGRAKYIDYRSMQQQVTPGGPQLTNVQTINRLKYNLQQEWNNRR